MMSTEKHGRMTFMRMVRYSYVVSVKGLVLNIGRSAGIRRGCYFFRARDAVCSTVLQKVPEYSVHTVQYI